MPRRKKKPPAPPPPTNPPASPTRPISTSPSTIPTSLSFATSAISRFPAAHFRLKFMDIAATVNPATVHFRSLTDPDKLGVIEQNYEYDLLEPAKLLHKYVGKEVTLVRSYRTTAPPSAKKSKPPCSPTTTAPSGKSATTSSPACYAESYRFPEVPANLYDRPTLLMSLENSGAQKTADRSLLSRQQSFLERRLRPHRRPRRQSRRPRRLGHCSSTTAAPPSTTLGSNSSPAS